MQNKDIVSSFDPILYVLKGAGKLKTYNSGVAESGDTDPGPAEKGADSAGLAPVTERLD